MDVSAIMKQGNCLGKKAGEKTITAGFRRLLQQLPPDWWLMKIVGWRVWGLAAAADSLSLSSSSHAILTSCQSLAPKRERR